MQLYTGFTHHGPQASDVRRLILKCQNRRVLLPVRMNLTDWAEAKWTDRSNSSAQLPPHSWGSNNTFTFQEDLQEIIHTATLVTCTFLLAIIFSLGSYGNLIVFLSFFDPAFRKFRTNFDFMILNLSFCDLFICGVTAPMFTFALFLDSAAGIPDAFCFTFHLTSSGFIIMSLKTVAVIALHRLRMVLGKQPNRTASFPCTLLLTLVLWATSFTLATLATMRTQKSRLCLPISSLVSGEGKIIPYLYVIDFICCVAVVSVSYIMIAQALKKNAQVRKCPPVITVDASRPQPLIGPLAAGCTDGVQCAVPALYRNQHYNKLQHIQTHAYTKSLSQLSAPAAGRFQLVSTMNLSAAKDSKAVVTCIVIVLSVLVCCLPLGISLVQDVLSRNSGFILYQFELCGFTLIFFKSGLNPFIYSRNSAGLRRRVLWCLQYLALVFFCCKQKTRLRAVGKGSLEANRNKSSHHETNSAYMLSSKPQKKFVDQACGPSHSKESVLSPKGSASHQHYGGQSSSTPMNTRIEPYYSIYNSCPSQEASTPNSLQPTNSPFGFAQSYIAMHYHTTNDLVRDFDSTSAKQIPVPSV
ncbi:probable G-protein coupled receptor 75 isoform X1 [Rhineura floridana]|uniref:probable G-protein coupled receptor 75 isoform X1 n=2 Tax=Rhineura floridana TaxID=261503 RepID=UPI002AC894B5|nr:probable G-protein coupled receptor 75 isoform X1 [Rhineura floridana]XP_061481691.1 probable G-protein coupled receptor 75 isoform X1 [Rhineura floridana]XP_061481692.1 probable G-protein coupled receptor 75 isoform X1 [Rhineura floridana]